MDNALIFDNNILLCMDTDCNVASLDFCGIVEYKTRNSYDGKTVYFCGDVSLIEHLSNIILVGNFCYNNNTNFKIIPDRQLPRNIYNVGVMLDQYFEPRYFNRIVTEHDFQNLTESNKGTNAYRTGLYITDVNMTDQGYKEFNLLRCSTNFSGPTHGKRSADNEIMSSVNTACKSFFKEPVLMNHALAQRYNNNIENGKKASIKQHSDKTKDMSRSGLLAFCTFYNDDDLELLQMTKLRFKLKSDVNNNCSQFKQKFDVVLTPNSLFIISLTMNRLYTHEIIPGQVPISQLPTRLGYVVRSSDTKCLWKDGESFIKQGDELVKMIPANVPGVERLKGLYYQENMTSNKVTYEGFDFSLNSGDYLEPLI